MRYWLCAAIACGLVPVGSVAAVDFAALAAALDSEQFADREAAERALLQGGLEMVQHALAESPLPAGAADDQIDRHFEKLTAEVNAALKDRLYRHLDEAAGLEARFRAKRLRLAIDQHLAQELARAQVGLNKRLAADVAEKVYGYTGGFRDGTTWFDAEFGNNSQHTVTSIRILVRLTHKETGEKIEKQVALTADAPLLPGEKAIWSADVGIAQTKDHEFFWGTLAVFGSPPAPSPIANEPQRSIELP
jgi:hypothetical protein